MGKSLYQVKLEARKRKDKKDSIITDMDYVLRDKDEKDVAKNTRDMTPDGVAPGDYEAKHKAEIEALKEELKQATEPKESERDQEIEDLKSQIALLAKSLEPKEAEAPVQEDKPAPKTTAKKTTGTK